MKIVANFLLVLCLLGICEAGQEVLQYAETRNVPTLIRDSCRQNWRSDP